MTSADLTALVKKQPVGFACLVLSVIFAALIYFRSGKITENQAEYEAKSAEAAKIISNVSVSKNLPEQVTEMQAAGKELEARLVKAGQLAVNLQYFYKLEAENEVKLQDVRQNDRPRSTKTLYMGIPYTVSLQGSYKQVVAFLQRLEGGRHFCRINTAILNKVAGGGEGSSSVSGPSMNLSLTLDLLGQP